MCFGVLLGWVLATMNDSRITTTAPAAAAAAAPQQEPSAGNERAPAQLDEGEVQALTTILTNDPNNAGAAAQLAETYFRAEKMEEAIKWYREALRLDPKNVNASTQNDRSMSPKSVQSCAAPKAKTSQRIHRSAIDKIGDPTRWFTCIKTSDRRIPARIRYEVCKRKGDGDS